MNKLKPCPFCGCGEAGTQWHHGYWSVTCGYCHDATPSKHCFQDWGEFETEEDAIKAWNERVYTEESMFLLELPCNVGDTVYAYLGNIYKDGKKNERIFDECIIKEISIEKDSPEPLFYAVCYEKADYATFWLSEFGKDILTKEQYFQLLLEEGKDDKK